MRKSESGESVIGPIIMVLIVLFLIFVGYASCRQSDGELLAPCLKKHLGLEHNEWKFSKDEARALAPAVQKKSSELLEAENTARRELQGASKEDRVVRLTEYRQARDDFECFSKAIVFYGLTPPESLSDIGAPAPQ